MSRFKPNVCLLNGTIKSTVFGILRSKQWLSEFFTIKESGRNISITNEQILIVLKKINIMLYKTILLPLVKISFQGDMYIVCYDCV